MHLIIRDFWERRHAGVILFATRNCLRVALQGRDDTVELKNVNQQWILEGEGIAEIEAILIPAEEGYAFSKWPPPENAALTARAAH